MPDYEKMYHILFNAITNALRELEAGRTELAARLLMEAQRETEKRYIEAKRLVKLRATGIELSIPQFLSRMEVENLTRPGVYKRQVTF